jgi:hypothetical protein
MLIREFSTAILTVSPANGTIGRASMSTLNELMDGHRMSLGSLAGTGPVPSVRDVTDEIDAFLNDIQDRLVRGTFDVAATLPKSSYMRKPVGTTVRSIPTGDFAILVDDLRSFFRTCDVTYRFLLIGKLLEMRRLPSPASDEQEGGEEIVREVRRRFIILGNRGLAPVAREWFLTELEPMLRSAASRASEAVKVLCLGDCLTRDEARFLSGACWEDQTDFIPTFLDSLDPLHFRKSVQAQPGDGFDLVLYRPFSDRFAADLPSYRDRIDAELEEAGANLELIERHFDCPILIQNADGVRPRAGRLNNFFKSIIHWKARRLARHEANRFLGNYRRIHSPFSRISILGEDSRPGRRLAWKLGLRRSTPELQRRSVFGRNTAAQCFEHISARTEAMTRKPTLIVKESLLCEGR